MSRGSRPSGKGLLYMAGVSLLVVFAYERAKDKATPATVVRAARRAA